MTSNPIFAARFQAPFLRPNRVTRERLLEKIEQGHRSGARLTLICAPAGYGKTTLAVEWLQQHDPFAWLSIDEGDSDPARILTNLVTTLRAIDPQVGARTLSLLQVPQLPPVEHLVSELIGELASIRKPFILALDDYHLIHQAAVHEAMEFLINYMPANLHLLIISREDPAFSLSRMRANGWLTEIRAYDLRFVGDEVRTFLTDVHHLNLPQSSLEKLSQMTEGWVAGLQLAGLAIQTEEDVERFFDTFTGAHPYIISYLMDEVIHRQTRAVQQILINTSILDRFNADLCAAVAIDPDRPAGEESIDFRALLLALDRANLFLTPLDSSHTWFRYHRLFADALLSGLEPQRKEPLHLRAARWFEANNMPEEAIPHYLAAKAVQPAARLIRRLADGLVRHGEMQTLLGWLKALPAAELRSDLVLLAYQALALLLTGHLQDAQRLIDDADISQQNQASSGPLYGILAWLRLVTGAHDGPQALAERALATLEPQEAVFRVLALLVLGSCYYTQNNPAASNEAYQEAYRIGLATQHPFAALAGLENLAFNMYDLGHLRHARLLCMEAQERFTDARGNPLPVLGMIDVTLSVFCLEQRDLAQAEAYASRGRALCQKLFSSGMEGGDAETVLARAAYLQGRREEGYQILAEMRQFAVAHQVATLEDKMNVAESDLYLMDGDALAASACLERLENHPHSLIPVVAFTRQIQLAEIELLQRRPQAALDLLESLAVEFRFEGRTLRAIRWLGVKAGALHQLGWMSEALAVMEEAVSLSAPEGYLNSFLSMPREAAALLPKVRAAAPEFVDQALALLAEQQKIPTRSPAPAPVTQPARPNPLPDVEPLSEQEQNILRLLAAGNSNQEIADVLVISVGTVKWHVHNILGKLGAANRSQAAVKARALGLT